MLELDFLKPVVRLLEAVSLLIPFVNKNNLEMKCIVLDNKFATKTLFGTIVSDNKFSIITLFIIIFLSIIVVEALLYTYMASKNYSFYLELFTDLEEYYRINKCDVEDIKSEVKKSGDIIEKQVNTVDIMVKVN